MNDLILDDMWFYRLVGRDAWLGRLGTWRQTGSTKWAAVR